MKKYQFVEVKVQNNPVANAELSEHRQIITEMAQKGYKFAGYVPVKQGPSGKFIVMDLIFETEE